MSLSYFFYWWIFTFTFLFLEHCITAARRSTGMTVSVTHHCDASIQVDFTYRIALLHFVLVRKNKLWFIYGYPNVFVQSSCHSIFLVVTFTIKRDYYRCFFYRFTFNTLVPPCKYTCLCLQDLIWKACFFENVFTSFFTGQDRTNSDECQSYLKLFVIQVNRKLFV